MEKPQYNSINNLSGFTVTQTGIYVYLTLNDYPPERYVRSDIMDVPYVQINAKTDWPPITLNLYEGEKPVVRVPKVSLEFINVPTEITGHGLGKQLVISVLDWMRHNKTDWLALETENLGFWVAMKNFLPNNIAFVGGEYAIMYRNGFDPSTAIIL